MKQAFQYKDEKSDKFWCIETLGCELMVNWGKSGTTGRYEIKSFNTENECEKQAAKLALSKTKKGCIAMQNFDAIHHLYFDTPEYRLHRLTCHPIFRKYFSDDLYYDCGDEEAPFGNDTGNDTLYLLEECMRKHSKMCIADFPQLLIEKEWGLTYLPPKPEQTDDELKIQAEKNYNGLQGEEEILQTDQVILATAFGQIKISGKLDTMLQELAFQSLIRIEKMYRLLWNWNDTKPPYNISIMQRDLTRFVNRKPL